MYNRYVPLSDGSYTRKSVQPQKPSQQKQQPTPAPPPQEPPPLQRQSETPGILGFLRQLLPKEFDTGDLLIVLLLLLMAGDREEEKQNALLTLAFYFLM